MRTFHLTLPTVEQRSMTEIAVATISGILGGGLGLHWVQGWQQRRKERKDGNQAVELRIIEDGTSIREELRAENRQLHEELRKEMERRHQAELLAAKFEARNAELERRLGRADQHLTDALKLRERAQTGAGAMAGPEGANA